MKNNCCPSTYSITNFIRLGFCWFRNNFFFRSLLLLCCWLLLLFSLLYVFFLSTVWSMVIFIVCFCYGVERKISNVHTHFIYWIHIIHLFAVCLLFWWVLCMHWLFSVILWNLHTKKTATKHPQQQQHQRSESAKKQRQNDFDWMRRFWTQL